MLKGLITFQTDYPEAQALLLYRGNERLLINNILCLPCEQFLKNLIPGQPQFLNEEALYQCACDVEADEVLNKEMAHWDATVEDGLEDETW